MAFVKELVQLLTDDDLELRNQEGETALCFAAKSGIVAIAKEMVKKTNRLPLVRSREERKPLHKAALLGLRDIVSYRFTVTSFDGLGPPEHMEILVAAISHEMFGTSHISIILSLRQLIENAIISFDVLTENFDWA